MAKHKAKRRPPEPAADLRLFNTEHPELQLHKRSQRDLIRFLTYWLIEIHHGGIAMFPGLLDKLFDALDLNAPSDSANALAKLKHEDELVKMSIGYRPSAHLREAMKEELENAPPLLKVEPEIASLVEQVKRAGSKSFLEEAHLCLRANAPRAAIVMTWTAVMDHLYDYVLKNKLTAFNVELAKKGWKLTAIISKDDFSEIKKEKDFIEICRAANVFNNDVRKILDEKLGIRNTAGHPSTVTVRGNKAASFIEDLVENVILKFPI
jgi:hypothetical protein